MRLKISSSVTALLIVLSIGCDADPRRGSVKGRVTVDGTPLRHGRIEFLPTGGTSGPVAGGVIVDGHYHIRRDKGPVVGKNRVEVNGSVKTDEPKPYPPEDSERTEFLTPEDLYQIRGVRPLEFEPEVPMEADIQAGANVLDFPLRSK